MEEDTRGGHFSFFWWFLWGRVTAGLQGRFEDVNRESLLAADCLFYWREAIDFIPVEGGRRERGEGMKAAGC